MTSTGNLVGAADCATCPAGHFTYDIGTPGCYACPPGKFSWFHVGVGWAKEEADASFVALHDSKTAGTGRRLREAGGKSKTWLNLWHNDDALRFDRRGKHDMPADTVRDDVCVPCPEGATCINGDQVVVLEDNWRASTSRSRVYACQFPGQCLGMTAAQAEALDQNKAGRARGNIDDPVCSLCKNGFIGSGLTGLHELLLCQPCTHGWTTYTPRQTVAAAALVQQQANRDMDSCFLRNSWATEQMLQTWTSVEKTSRLAMWMNTSITSGSPTTAELEACPGYFPFTSCVARNKWTALESSLSPTQQSLAVQALILNGSKLAAWFFASPSSDSVGNGNQSFDVGPDLVTLATPQEMMTAGLGNNASMLLDFAALMAAKQLVMEGRNLDDVRCLYHTGAECTRNSDSDQKLGWSEKCWLFDAGQVKELVKKHHAECIAFIGSSASEVDGLFAPLFFSSLVLAWDSLNFCIAGPSLRKTHPREGKADICGGSQDLHQQPQRRLCCGPGGVPLDQERADVYRGGLSCRPPRPSLWRLRGKLRLPVQRHVPSLRGSAARVLASPVCGPARCTLNGGRDVQACDFKASGAAGGDAGVEDCPQVASAVARRWANAQRSSQQETQVCGDGQKT